MVHNSQMLKRISNIAPKARFISGKGASGAGLTAAVVKDEFLKGWSLEAGALVLANKGIACIDELDKMSKEDTSAMHEALEQQTVTINKANIQATLRSETTVLAAANPKFGRFDPYEIISKQIDLPPTLLNRFDLIFPVRDMPDKTKDEKLASFILSLHKEEGGQEGIIKPEMIKKYVAYARQRIFPKLTEPAMIELKDYYVKMRGGNESGDTSIKAIPISARQLEALVRLSEASARMRLSDKVTKRDAQVAIELVHYCLNQIGMDPDTGKIDIDRITTGITASQRSHISVIKELIQELEATIGKAIPIDDIVREAGIKGIADDTTNEVIEKLKRAGDIYSPKHGFVSRL
jgi:replicative DNA helicase Mcm